MAQGLISQYCCERRQFSAGGRFVPRPSDDYTVAISVYVIKFQSCLGFPFTSRIMWRQPQIFIGYFSTKGNYYKHFYFPWGPCAQVDKFHFHIVVKSLDICGSFGHRSFIRRDNADKPVLVCSPNRFCGSNSSRFKVMNITKVCSLKRLSH